MNHKKKKKRKISRTFILFLFSFILRQKKKRYLQDPHPRVRYAACNAIGQMSTDFANVFQKKFHDKVIPGLLMLLDDNANPRVQAHAGKFSIISLDGAEILTSL